MRQKMRNLNKIIFINSAQIPYSEILLDGNVHFTGTQGVGKSTILRAILFFYNADTQKLGIPSEKKTYADYYFPYSNSYIVYEVARESGAFCILTFKAMNRVCYRFIDSPYQKEFFIDEHRMVYSGSDKIRAALDQQKIKYSRIVNTYEEYRNILYGSGLSGKEFNRYSLMESKLYQNIPRTIQNVLLNSKLDAEFIKQTIISSLNEEETAINLNGYKEHLRKFEVSLKDIEEFQKKETLQQAERVSELFQKTSMTDSGIAQNCKELIGAFNRVQNELPKWQAKEEKTEQEKSALLGKKRSLEERSNERCRKIREQLAIRENDLKRAREKEAEYARIGIDLLLEHRRKRPELINRLNGLEEEKRLLTAQYLEVTTKYKSLIQILDEQWNRFHGEKIRQLQLSNETYNKKLEEARKKYQEQLNDLFNTYTSLSDRLSTQRQEKSDELNRLEYTLKLCRKEIFFEQEQKELAQRIQTYLPTRLEKQNRIQNAQIKIKEITMQWQQEQEAQFARIKERHSLLQADAERLNNRIIELRNFLENSKRTLQGWLKDNKPGWEETIGKICDENLLWQTNLAPELADDSESLYGLSISLNEINRNIKSIDDYQDEKESAEKRLAQSLAEISKLNDEKELVTDQLKQKYQRPIKDQKKTISLLEYEMEQLTRQHKQDRLDLEALQKKAEQEKNQKLSSIQEEQDKVRSEIQQISSQTAQLKEEQSKKRQRLDNDWKRTQKALAGELDALKQKAHIEEEEEKARLSREKKIYETQMNQELQTQGADTNRLQEISASLAIVEQELSTIDANEKRVVEYEKDKRELIDQIPVWQKERKDCADRLNKEMEVVARESASLLDKIKKQEEALLLVEENIRLLRDDIQAYQKINAYDWCATHTDLFKDEAKIFKTQTNKSCVELIDELTRLSSQYTRLKSDLRKEVSLFTGHFSDENIFKFRTKFNEDDEYLRFADELHDFMQEQKIEQYILRINNEHSDIFKRITMDTSLLTSSEGAIEDVIRKINRGFETSNFVGVIQRIEMKVQNSSNKVVNRLREIKSFYDEHSFDLNAGMNLFSSENEFRIKQKAVSLLRDFMKEINNYRRDDIRLYDSFELEFRVIENQNDTGFTNRLSNVGSEGTDVLVKAMINIMLLNVFKEGASRRFKDFKLHCMMDEIGRLHPSNIAGILKFANDRNILLINGSPMELNHDAYRHVYMLSKNKQSLTRISKLITVKNL